MHSRPADKSELIRDMTDAHQRVVVILDSIPDERLLDPATDEWTGKDLLAHMAWWHDHSARVIASLHAGREPYDRNDPANTTDTINRRVHDEHLEDSPATARRTFDASFTRLLRALEPLTEEELFADDRWPWLDGEPLVEMVLWDSSRHYDAHHEHLDRLSPAG